MQVEVFRTPWLLRSTTVSLFLVSLLLFSPAPSQGRESTQWIRVSTPHFEMYTTNNEKQAIAALQVFEQVRYFFLQSNRSRTVPDATVRIIAFRSEKEYSPYRLNPGAFAYYLRSRKVDYIVMGDISPEHHQTAVHEYTHLLVEHDGLKLPLWLNEGLADLYSSLEAKGDRALVGRPLAGHSATLNTQRWLDLNSLFAVGPDSPYYNQPDKMALFYAESWELTHMLALSPNYKPGFGKFLSAVAAGRPAPECFSSVYGESLDQVTENMRAYFRQASVQGALFDVKLSKAALEPQVSVAPAFAVELTLADLLASGKRTSAEAYVRLSQLAAAHPASAEVQESLGYLAWEKGDLAKTRECFRLAFEKGSGNADMLYAYSQLLRESGAPTDQTRPVLQRVVALKPDCRDAWLELGIDAMNDKNFSSALDALSHVKNVDSDQAYNLFAALAWCDFQLKDFKQSRVMAVRARQYAKAPEEQFQAANLLQALDSEDSVEGPDVQTRPASSPSLH